MSDTREAGQPAHLIASRSGYINKNGYEIRAQLLDIAQRYLQAQYELNLEMWRAMFNTGMKQGYQTQLDVEKQMPKMYQFTDIVEHAKKLNDFVSNK